MRTFFRLLLLGLVLLVVALISALTSMQIAIHGREVRVPDFVGKNPAEAMKLADRGGLPLEVDRQYYSVAVPKGRIMSQSPAAGTKVRRGWQVLVAESLGPQTVQIPNILGQTERAAEMNIQRRGLDLNAVSEIALAGSVQDEVLAQNPSPNSDEASAPKIGLLISIGQLPRSFVMPDFTGQSIGRAISSLTSAGLRAGKVTENAETPEVGGVPPIPAPGGVSTPLHSTDASVVISQKPISGQKVNEGEVVDFTVR